MDIDRFDRLARRLGAPAARRASRRSVAAGVVAVLLAGGGAPPATACVTNGKPCDPRLPAQCCSGICKKSGKKHKCKPVLSVFGCAVERDFCETGDPSTTRCPDNPNGVCVVRDSGKPFCTDTTVCRDCVTDADCNALLDRRDSKCIKDCPACGNLSTGACVFPPLS